MRLKWCIYSCQQYSRNQLIVSQEQTEFSLYYYVRMIILTSGVRFHYEYVIGQWSFVSNIWNIYVKIIRKFVVLLLHKYDNWMSAVRLKWYDNLSNIHLELCILNENYAVINRNWAVLLCSMKIFYSSLNFIDHKKCSVVNSIYVKSEHSKKNWALYCVWFQNKSELYVKIKYVLLSTIQVIWNTESCFCSVNMQ